MGCHGCRTVLWTPSRSAEFNIWLLGSSDVVPISGLCHVNGSRAVPTGAWQLMQPVAGSVWPWQLCSGSHSLRLRSSCGSRCPRLWCAAPPSGELATLLPEMPQKMLPGAAHLPRASPPLTQMADTWSLKVVFVPQNYKLGRSCMGLPLTQINKRSEPFSPAMQKCGSKSLR